MTTDRQPHGVLPATHTPTTVRPVSTDTSSVRESLNAWAGRREVSITHPPATRSQTVFRTDALYRALDDLAHDGMDMATAQVLDVGSASGYGLKPFLTSNMALSQLHGIDLMEDRVELGRQLLPGMDLQAGDATAMPYEDATFDLVCEQFCFCHIPDDTTKEAVAAEMMRVVKPDGAIIVMDWRMVSPKRMIYGTSRARMGELFGGYEVAARYPAQLWPPLGRRLSKHLPAAYPLAMKVPGAAGAMLTVLRRH